MADLGLLSGIATGIKSAMGSYQDAEKYKAEKERQAVADALQKKMFQLSMIKSGYEDSPGGLIKTASAEEQDDLDKRFKEAQINKLYADASGEKLKTKKPSDAQFKAARFAHDMRQAENVFEGLASEGFDPTTQKYAFEQGRFVPELFMSSNAKKQAQAERNFVEAVMRPKSGAAITENEFRNARKQYFPMPGDSKETIEQKKLNRQQAYLGLRAEAGDAYDSIKEVPGFVPGKKNKMMASGGRGLIPAAKAADSAPPDFDNMSIEELRKYTAGK